MRTLNEPNCASLLKDRGVKKADLPTEVYLGIVSAMQSAFEYGKRSELMHTTYKAPKIGG